MALLVILRRGKSRVFPQDGWDCWLGVPNYNISLVPHCMVQAARQPDSQQIFPGDKTKLKTKEINYFDYWTFALPSINAYIFSQMGDKSEP